MLPEEENVADRGRTGEPILRRDALPQVAGVGVVLVRSLDAVAILAEVDTQAVVERLAPWAHRLLDRTGVPPMHERARDLDVADHLVLSEEALADGRRVLAADRHEERKRLVGVADLPEERAITACAVRRVEIPRGGPLDEAREEPLLERVAPRELARVLFVSLPEARREQDGRIEDAANRAELGLLQDRSRLQAAAERLDALDAPPGAASRCR